MRTRVIFGSRAQSASLIALGAFAIDQVRYLFADGSRSGDELARQGHNYLGHALPMVVGFALAVLSAWLVRGAIGGRGVGAERRIKATSYALGIAAVFCCQELMEGALFVGHASGLAAIFSTGGWAALPLAALFGVLAALIDRGMEAIEIRLAEVPPHVDRAPLQVKLPDPAKLGRRLSPLALGPAQRPPPALA